MDRVVVDKPSNPALAHTFLSHRRREILYHLPCRRYMTSSKLSYISYKLLLLLWGELLLVKVLDLWRCLNTSVSLGQRQAINAKLISNFLIHKFLSWFQRINCCKRIINRCHGG